MKPISVGVIVLFLLNISGCFDQPPEALALKFIQTGNYDLLSQKDKDVYSKREFSKIWHLDTELQLEPTSKYFLLEKYLLVLVKHEISNIEKLNNKTKITITTSYPKVLSDFWFSDMDLMSKESLDKLDNLNSLYSRNMLDISDLKFIDKKDVIEVLSDGVYVDLARIKASKETSRKIKVLVEPIESILDEDSEISSLIISASDPDKFNDLLKMSNGIDDKIESVALVKEKILEIDPKKIPYSVETYLKNAKNLSGIATTFENVKLNIEFNELKISKSKGGVLGLFGNFIYKGNDKIKYGHAIAYFLDSKGELIGKQKLDYLLSDLYKGKVKSFGREIDDQFMASKAKKIEIEPLAIF